MTDLAHNGPIAPVVNSEPAEAKVKTLINSRANIYQLKTTE